MILYQHLKSRTLKKSHLAKFCISQEIAVRREIARVNSLLAKFREEFACEYSHFAKFRIMRKIRMRKIFSHFAKFMRTRNGLCEAMRMRNFAKFSLRMRILRISHAKAHPCLEPWTWAGACSSDTFAAELLYRRVSFLINYASDLKLPSFWLTAGLA